jgi:hypothetical protein
MNIAIAAFGAAPAVGIPFGDAGAKVIAGLSVAGLLLLLVALRSSRPVPVYVVRDIGRRF